ncbi:MAG: uracil-DNA glycosylase family protein [bacterium]
MAKKRIFAKCQRDLDNLRGHKLTWESCNMCPLHSFRKQVVLFRGYIPCHILFIGEAPGPGEDVLGYPFIADAGREAEELIETTLPARIRYGMTNVVACVPRDSRGGKFREPNKHEIAACYPRLREIVGLCKPGVLATIGAVAKDSPLPFDLPVYNLEHTSSIMRAEDKPKVYAMKRSKFIMALQKIVKEHFDA